MQLPPTHNFLLHLLSFILSLFWVSLLSAGTVVQVIFGFNPLQFVLNICYLLDMLWVWLVLGGFRQPNFDNKPATLSVHKPAIERVQALADLSHWLRCCHSNKTHAMIANTPNSAQLDRTPYTSPKLHVALCNSMGMWRGTGPQMAMANIHFASAMPHAKCNDNVSDSYQAQHHLLIIW